MAHSKISEFSALTTIASDDILAIVDISDTSMAASGTTKKITTANLIKTSVTKTVATTSSGLPADYYTDGTADDVQIQAAIDAVEALGGGIVHIKLGTYDITAAMTVGSNMTIEGDGFGTILKHTAGAGFNGLIKNDDQVSGNTRIILQDFTIDGNKANVTGSDPRDLIWLKVVTKSICKNLNIFDGADSGIVLDQATTINNIVENCIVDNCTDIGIYISVANQNIINANQVLNTGSYGIRVVNSGAIRNVVTNNYVFNCGQTSTADGIIISNGDGSTVSGNVVYGSGRYGIQNTSPYVTISGNNVIFSDQHGIFLSGAMRSQVTGNTVHQSSQTTSNTYSGIYLDNAAEVTVTGNRSGDTGSGTRQKYGIEEAGTSNTNVIMGNMLERNGTAGFVKVGAATQVFGNSNWTTNNVVGTLLVSSHLEIDGNLDHDGSNIGFFGVTPTTRQTELTDELTSITHTAPGTPDYALQDLVQNTGFGFVTKDEGNTVLSVIANLQTRVNELETKLAAYGLLQDAD